MSRFDRKCVFLGTTDGQLFKSLDGGKIWSPIFPGTGRRRLVIDTLVEHPVEAGHIFAGGWDLRTRGGALFESRDNGLTWNPHALPEASPAIRDLAICRNRPAFMIAGTLSGVYLTDDAGAHWVRLRRNGVEFENVESVAIDPQDPRFLYVGTWRLGYRSSDSGRSWLFTDNGMLLDSDVFSIAVAQDNPQIVYASACSGIYRSENRAQSWTRLKVLPDRFAIRTQVVALDPANPHRVYGGTTEGLWVSNNDGQAWTRLTPSALTINAIQISPEIGGEILIGTSEQGVLLSGDGGRTWKESNYGFAGRQVSRIIADPNPSGRIYVVLSADEPRGGVHLYDAPAAQWTALTVELASRTRILSFLPIPGAEGHLAATSEGLYRRRNNSPSWLKMADGINLPRFSSLEIDPGGCWIYAAAREGLYRGDSKTFSFQRVATRGSRPEIHYLIPRAGPAAELFAAGGTGIVRSRDQGVTWEGISSGIPARAIVQCVAVSPATDRHLLAGTKAGLYESWDGGDSWQRAADSRLGIDVPAVIFLNRAGEALLAADNTFGGVFLSRDSGRNWEKLASPRFGSPVTSLLQDPGEPGTIYLGTQSEGVYRLRLPEPPAFLPAKE